MVFSFCSVDPACSERRWTLRWTLRKVKSWWAATVRSCAGSAGGGAAKLLVTEGERLPGESRETTKQIHSGYLKGYVLP